MSELRTPPLAERFRGALLGAAAGDALGAPFEGRPAIGRDEISGVAHGEVPLRHTDDTAMTLAMARSFAERRGFDGPHLASAFATEFEREPWRGYGAGPPQIFAALAAGVGWNQASRRLFGGAGSFGNGGAMRVAPAALLGHLDLDRVEQLADQSAIVTHAHPVGIDGAVVQAVAVSLLLSADRRDPFPAAPFLDVLRIRARTHAMATALDAVVTLPRDARPSAVVDRLGNGIEAHRSVPTAIHCFLSSPGSFVEAVFRAVELGGDADTIASMTGALSGAYLGERAVPPAWANRIEARTELRDLADRLHRIAGAPASLR